MRLRDRRSFQKPEVMIIPMIDIMFFLLVFFMLSTLYMVNIKTIPVNMLKTENAQMQARVNYLVSMRKDGTLYLEDKAIDQGTLLAQAQAESKKNPNFAVVIRADKDIDYTQLMSLLDALKGAGITRFGLASDGK
ncbi:ExbD/TolR family protein [Pectinatus cerevisiiphilus]|uniref:Biopolymer transport protein ExbD n=1 Tax=Pectinatus cerevisiiphilus TaxID=86956 RepID=A0A4R3K1Q1_9FIRM|nr:biopolymer transporter ExbD [Pectinatus cerevisiiphilus]TCS75755.1 biopolymer transport protein ExbD [Pectinatus cerevisiiphilus]